MQNLHIFIFSMLSLVFGSWIILDVVTTPLYNEEKQIYYEFQEVVYTQTLIIKFLYSNNDKTEQSLKAGKISKEDYEKVNNLLADLQIQKETYYNQIQYFPEELSNLKGFALDIMTQSEATKELYDNNFNDSNPIEVIDQTYRALNMARKETYECSIFPDEKFQKSKLLLLN